MWPGTSLNSSDKAWLRIRTSWYAGYMQVQWSTWQTFSQDRYFHLSESHFPLSSVALQKQSRVTVFLLSFLLSYLPAPISFTEFVAEWPLYMIYDIFEPLTLMFNVLKRPQSLLRPLFFFSLGLTGGVKSSGESLIHPLPPKMVRATFFVSSFTEIPIFSPHTQYTQLANHEEIFSEFDKSVLD